MNLVKTLLQTLLFIIPFITGYGLYFLGIPSGYGIDLGFEFPKVIFFNISMTFIMAIFFSYLILKKDLSFFKTFSFKDFLFSGSIIGILYGSSLTSILPFNSIMGDEIKAHSAVMFINLLFLYYLLRYIFKDNIEVKYALHTIIYSIMITACIGIIQYIFPLFSSTDIGNRLFGTLGHPNLIAPLFLLIIPYLILQVQRNDKYRYIFILIIVVLALILTKSIIALGIFGLYICYYVYKNVKINKYYLFGFLSIIIISISFIIYNFGVYTKLASFISRFYIWETTMKIIFSDIKTLFLGSGLDTLSIYFDSFKSKELYIYENIGLTVDRPHNIFLNILYHTGLIGLGIFSYILYYCYKNLRLPYIKQGLLMVLLFLCFNFGSITLYIYMLVFVAIDLSYSYKPDTTNTSDMSSSITIFLVIIITSLCGSYFGYMQYQSKIAETNIKLNIMPYNYKYMIVENYKEGLLNPLIYNSKKPPELLLKRNIIYTNDLGKVYKNCQMLIKQYNSVENAFFCGDKILQNYNNNNLAKKYYSIGKENLPDLWNPDSYYFNSWHKYFFTTHRFFHEKFGIKRRLNSLKE